MPRLSLRTSQAEGWYRFTRALGRGLRREQIGVGWACQDNQPQPIGKVSIDFSSLISRGAVCCLSVGESTHTEHTCAKKSVGTPPHARPVSRLTLPSLALFFLASNDLTLASALARTGSSDALTLFKQRGPRKESIVHVLLTQRWCLLTSGTYLGPTRHAAQKSNHRVHQNQVGRGQTTPSLLRCPP